MRTPEILIEDVEGSGKRLAMNTKVWLLRYDEQENEERIDISSLVRGVSMDIRVGEPLTARLDLFLGGMAARTEVEAAVIEQFQPRKRRWYHRWFHRDPIQVTHFGAAHKVYLPGLKDGK